MIGGDVIDNDNVGCDMVGSYVTWVGTAARGAICWGLGGGAEGIGPVAEDTGGGGRGAVCWGLGGGAEGIGPVAEDTGGGGRGAVCWGLGGGAEGIGNGPVAEGPGTTASRGAAEDLEADVGLSSACSCNDNY